MDLPPYWSLSEIFPYTVTQKTCFTDRDKNIWESHITFLFSGYVCRGAMIRMSNYLYYLLPTLHFLVMLLFDPRGFRIGNYIHPSSCVCQNVCIKCVIPLGFIQVCAFSLHSLLDGEYFSHSLDQFGWLKACESGGLKPPRWPSLQSAPAADYWKHFHNVFLQRKVLQHYHILECLSTHQARKHTFIYQPCRFFFSVGASIFSLSQPLPGWSSLSKLWLPTSYTALPSIFLVWLLEGKPSSNSETCFSNFILIPWCRALSIF